MSFLTERFFQILDKHRLYGLINGPASLQYFMERHVLCVWGYHELIKGLQADIVRSSQPINTEPYKQVLRLINEIVLDEQVDQLPDGRIVSHLELYLEVMEELDCNMDSVFTFFDCLESGMKPKLALRSVEFPVEVSKFAEFLISCFDRPMHQRATILFYEGEPFVPDFFLQQLERISTKSHTDKLIDYWERHIEGLKRPGFSTAGRLVEVLCMDDPKLNREAEEAAEQIMAKRIDLWNAIAIGLEKKVGCEIVQPKPVHHLHLVR